MSSSIDKPDVSELFQDQFDVIGEAIGSVANFDRTIDKLFARKLVSRAVYDDLTTTNSYSIYQKGTKVVRELNRQIESSKEPEKTLVKICDVLQNIEDRRLRDVVDKIKIKLEGSDKKEQGETGSDKKDQGETLDISALMDVIQTLKDNYFSASKWIDLGLSLGLYHPTLKDIDAQYKDINDCLRECLAKWLNKEDNVEKKGVPSWTSLIKGLRTIGDKALAEKIEELYCK